MTRPVRFEHDGFVSTITLDHAPANALGRSLVESLEGMLEALRDDTDTRVVIITGSGPKAFCAGADLKERGSMTPGEVRAFVPRLQGLTDLVASVPMPTIAAINGAAFGGGLELALACDLRLASSYASMGLTETSLAIIPGAGGTVRLPMLVGSGRAKELIFTARRIDASEAQAIGLVQEVCEPENLLPRARELATAIAANGPLAVRAAKHAIDASMHALGTALAAERDAYASLIDTADRVEGLDAFRQKRPPHYQGK